MPNDSNSDRSTIDVEEHIAEIETVRLVLTQHRVLPRDNKHRLPDLPDGFYGSIAAHLTDMRSSETLRSHIEEALTYHNVRVHVRRIEAAVDALLQISSAWEPRGRFRTIDEEISGLSSHRSKRIDLLERVTQNQVYRSRPIEHIVVKYKEIAVGHAHHSQYYGWRRAVDVLMDRVVATLSPPRGRSSDEDIIHAEFESLTVQYLSYPLLAAWRLCLEIQLKSTFEDLREAIPDSEAVKSVSNSALKTHKLSPIWTGISIAVNEILDALVEHIPEDDRNALRVELEPAWVGIAITELESLDSDGQELRYPRDLSGKMNMREVQEIELSRLHADFQSVESYLHKISQFASAAYHIRDCDRRIDELSRGENVYRNRWL
ncbi:MULTISPECIES: hypothetical protein [unclassified Pseudonocardia]|uniref:hypothetical protein n=1 Tax=unclassified Pseudonocardia TaxID=2619320 RepID=UPI000ABAC830|nr:MULTISPECIES: hypothetical protein [unclassified Pseudonocardia]